MEKYNTDLNPSGMLSIYGRRPGTPYPYSGPMTRDQTLYTLSYTTTQEAIKTMLPKPLEPIPDLPPVISAFYAFNKHFRGFSGRFGQYHEVGFFVPAQYKGVQGLHPMWILMDSPTGDKTDGCEEGMYIGREMGGWVKLMAKVKAGGTGNQLHVTADVRGVRLMTLDIETPEEIALEEVPFAGFDNFIFVKEIPNCNFTGYDVRKVIGSKIDFLKSKETIYNIRTGTGSVTLGHLESHPLDILEVVETGPAFQLTFDTDHDTVVGMFFEIEDLLK
jgi:acetoacetate decarboxylase